VYHDYQNGVFAGTDNLIETVTGRKPITVADYVASNKTLFQPAVS